MGDALKGKAVVITGGGRGIGRETALAMGREGANILVNDIGGSALGIGNSAGPADGVAEEVRKLGVEAIPNYESVADFQAAGRIIKSCVDAFGRIDILVNCAGIIRDGFFLEMSEEDWDTVVAVHLKGTFNCCRHALPLMKDQNYGRVINFCSGLWVRSEGHVNYGAAKAGILSLTYGLGKEMDRYGVTVNAILPLASTRLHDISRQTGIKLVEAGLMTREFYEFMEKFPGAEFTPPMVVYLATDGASDISSQAFRIAEGKIIRMGPPPEAGFIAKDVEKEGAWKLEELMEQVPRDLMAD
ncbi:MAG: SDR family NAD(P)-dependent oxidoreductase [Dehalococcoidia bacterium]